MLCEILRWLVVLKHVLKFRVFGWEWYLIFVISVGYEGYLCNNVKRIVIEHEVICCDR